MLTLLIGMNFNIYNYLISSYKTFYYKITERIKLYISRSRNKNLIHNSNPLVSIIIATYNRSEILINRTIPSVLNQTHTNIEIVIVGDKCIDDTSEKIKEVQDPRIVYYDLPKRGKYPKGIKNRWFVQGSVPRNMGMKIAKGDWFVFISDDDIMLPKHIETLLNCALENKVEFVSASYKTIKNGNEVIVNPQPFGRDQIMIGGMQTWLYRSYLKTFKWNVDSWRKRWNKPVDYDLQLRFIDAGVTFTHLFEIVYFNPPVKGTNTTGFEAALIADNLD
jgi:glycosyltransferase involved in cell wall biosynthesis